MEILCVIKGLPWDSWSKSIHLCSEKIKKKSGGGMEEFPITPLVGRGDAWLPKCCMFRGNRRSVKAGEKHKLLSLSVGVCLSVSAQTGGGRINWGWGLFSGINERLQCGRIAAWNLARRQINQADLGKCWIWPVRLYFVMRHLCVLYVHERAAASKKLHKAAAKHVFLFRSKFQIWKF